MKASEPDCKHLVKSGTEDQSSIGKCNVLETPTPIICQQPDALPKERWFFPTGQLRFGKLNGGSGAGALGATESEAVSPVALFLNAVEPGR